MAVERGKWAKACDTNACVEVFVDEDGKTVSLSATGSHQILSLTGDEYTQFLADVKDGKFDL